MGGHGKCQTDIHSTAVALHRRIEESLDLSKIDNLVELALDLGPCHSEDGAVKKNVFASRQFGMKSGADFQERSDSSAQANSSRVGPATGRLRRNRFFALSAITSRRAV